MLSRTLGAEPHVQDYALYVLSLTCRAARVRYCIWRRQIAKLRFEVSKRYHIC